LGLQYLQLFLLQLKKYVDNTPEKTILPPSESSIFSDALSHKLAASVKFQLIAECGDVN
jgi:hypothetical protein